MKKKNGKEDIIDVKFEEVDGSKNQERMTDSEVVVEDYEEETIIEDILGKTTVKKGDKTIVRVNDEDIAIFGPNNEVLFCALPRVNLDDQNSILDYGSEYIQAISTLLKEVSQAAIADDSVGISEELIDSVKEFDTEIAEAKKKREKEENLPAIIKGGKNFLAKIGFEKFKVDPTKYSDEECYKAYCERICKLTNGVVAQAETCIKDMQLRGETVKDLMPLIHKLSIALTIGEYDLDVYKVETAKMEKGTYSMDISFEIERRKLNEDEFFTTLGDLRKSLALYQTKIGGYANQQKIDMSIVRTSARWVKVVSPILEANANLSLFNVRQARRLMIMDKIDKAGNDAIAESGKAIKANAELAVKLESEGGIRLQTIEGVHTQTMEGAKILESGAEKLRNRVASEQETLRKITAEESAFQGRLSQRNQGTILLDDSKPKIKAIGTKKGTY